MLSTRSLVAVLLLLFLPLACGRPDSALPDAPLPPIPPGESGILSSVDGTLHFRPCGAADSYPIRDETGSGLLGLVEELGYGAGSIHAHLTLDGEVARELRVAAPESPGCDRILPEGEYQLRGNEPFWGVTIQGSRAVWRTPEDLDGLEYGEGHWVVIPDGWRYEASGAGALPDSLVLEIQPRPCMDSMSGAHYPFTATARQGDRSYEGCALEGVDAVPPL